MLILTYEMLLILLTVTAMANGKEETMIVVYPENLNYKGRYCRNTIFMLIISAYALKSEHVVATNQQVVAMKRQQGGLVSVSIRGSVLFYSSAVRRPDFHSVEFWYLYGRTYNLILPLKNVL